MKVMARYVEAGGADHIADAWWVTDEQDRIIATVDLGYAIQPDEAEKIAHVIEEAINKKFNPKPRKTTRNDIKGDVIVKGNKVRIKFVDPEIPDLEDDDQPIVTERGYYWYLFEPGAHNQEIDPIGPFNKGAEAFINAYKVLNPKAIGEV